MQKLLLVRASASKVAKEPGFSIILASLFWLMRQSLPVREEWDDF